VSWSFTNAWEVQERCAEITMGAMISRLAFVCVFATALAVSPAAHAQTRVACSDLTRSGLVAKTRIETAQANAAASTPPVAAHCEIVGRVNERTGADGKPYAIGFRLRLPAEWNGRFFFQGGGGADGNLGNAMGAIGPGQTGTALSMGYAVVSTDGGHTAEAAPGVGGVLFGLDPQARYDYGYNAVDAVTTAAKRVVEIHYGKPPARSYFVGCSNGGRQGLVAASRFPDHFDGIVAGNPGFNLPRAALAEAWDSQAFALAATEKDASGQPYLPTAFSNEDMALVGRGILDRCDANDGLRDGIVEDARSCRFDPTVLQCTGAKDASCLSSGQVTALTRVFGGAKTASGTPIYTGWPWDPGIAGPGWRVWKLGMPNANRANSAINLTLGAGAVPYIFMTPPERVAGNEIAKFMFELDLNRAASRITNRGADFRQSSMEFMTPPSYDLSAFSKSGGKLILYHGAADPIFSLDDTIQAYGTTVRGEQQLARLFVVPGMNHCGGGPSTDMFDALTPLVNWVEKGVAPDRIVGTANPNSPWPGRTRPLCPYPAQASYTGTGDINDAANFRCVTP
jgi:hypothetical protein